MRRLCWLAVVASIPLLLSGCATLTKSSSQSVTINTKPSGAECTLEREGQLIAVVNPTPGTISVEKDKDVIRVVCKKEGFLDNAGELASKFEAMTFGNIIFGGIIGVGVDAASGAMHEYPPLLTITLIPTEFASAEARDAFFERLKADFLVESDAVKERINTQCQDDVDCERQLKALEEARRIKLDEIEAKRLEARIANPSVGP